MRKVELEELIGMTFEEGRAFLESAGYELTESATDRQAPNCDYIEDNYFALEDDEGEEADRISFAKFMNKNDDPANDDGTMDFVVKEEWQRV